MITLQKKGTQAEELQKQISKDPTEGGCDLMGMMIQSSETQSRHTRTLYPVAALSLSSHLPDPHPSPTKEKTAKTAKKRKMTKRIK